LGDRWGYMDVIWIVVVEDDKAVDTRVFGQPLITDTQRVRDDVGEFVGGNVCVRPGYKISHNETQATLRNAT
jgi:hypothetical protein